MIPPQTNRTQSHFCCWNPHCFRCFCPHGSHLDTPLTWPLRIAPGRSSELMVQPNGWLPRSIGMSPAPDEFFGPLVASHQWRLPHLLSSAMWWDTRSMQTSPQLRQGMGFQGKSGPEAMVSTTKSPTFGGSGFYCHSNQVWEYCRFYFDGNSCINP